MTSLRFQKPNSSVGQERRERPEPEAALAIGSFLCFAGALGAVMFFKIADENEKYVMLMLGALIGLVKDTFARYFSSTKGGQEQRREASEVTKTLAVAAAVPTVVPAVIPIDTQQAVNTAADQVAAAATDKADEIAAMTPIPGDIVR